MVVMIVEGMGERVGWMKVRIMSTCPMSLDCSHLLLRRTTADVRVPQKDSSSGQHSTYIRAILGLRSSDRQPRACSRATYDVLLAPGDHAKILHDARC